MPKGQTQKQVQSEIDFLRSQNPGAPSFFAHVTVLPGVEMKGEEAMAKAEELAKTLKVWSHWSKL